METAILEVTPKDWMELSQLLLLFPDTETSKDQHHSICSDRKGIEGKYIDDVGKRALFVPVVEYPEQ